MILESNENRGARSDAICEQVGFRRFHGCVNNLQGEMNSIMRMRNQIAVLMIGAILILQAASLAYAVSGSDTPAYAYDKDGGWGWPDWYSDADKVTGKLESYVYIYIGVNDAYGAVYASYSGSGDYRWRVEVDLELTAYSINVGIGGSDIYIRYELLDAYKVRIAIAEVWHGDYNGPGDNGDKSFANDEMSYSFGNSYDNVAYFGVVLHCYAGNGGKICQDSTHTTIDYPAYLEVNSISWTSY